MGLSQSYEVLFKQQDKHDETHFGFIKQVLLMASGLIGILVSLHDTTHTNDKTRLAFQLAIGLLAVGILFLTIALFSQVVQHREALKKWKKEVLMQDQNPYYTPKIVIGTSSKIYEFLEKIGYISLCFSIIFLSIYSILIA